MATESGMRQHHTKSHGRSLPNRVCKRCDEKFYDPKAQRTYCDDCYSNSGSDNGNWKNAKERTDCAVCGAEFYYYSSNKDGVYCSKCVAEAAGVLPENHTKEPNQIETNCLYCGREMTVVQSRLERNKRGVFCDQRCHGNWLSENIVGASHHQWEGGSIVYGQRWWRTRKLALERDEHECQNCGKTEERLGRKPDVHHIDRVRDFDRPQDAHTLDNVVTLCRSCHRSVESGATEIPS